MPAKTERLHALVSGRVQGVGFRSHVLYRASALNLKGWVRNTVRGEVEVVAEGDRCALDSLLEYLHSGPSNAHVDRVEASWSDATGEFRSFEVDITY